MNLEKVSLKSNYPHLVANVLSVSDITTTFVASIFLASSFQDGLSAFFPDGGFGTTGFAHWHGQRMGLSYQINHELGIFLEDHDKQENPEEKKKK
ncbi:hypothetical protein ACJX0J_007688, partial [Zea mays]